MIKPFCVKSKIKITEAKCFKEVAKVIGAKNAERELFIASQCKDCQFNASVDILGAFVWRKTKQGYEFWSLIGEVLYPAEMNRDD